MRDEDEIENKQNSQYMCIKPFIFLKLKKQIIRGHGVDGVAHRDPALRAQFRPPQHGELEPVHADQMS